MYQEEDFNFDGCGEVNILISFEMLFKVAYDKEIHIIKSDNLRNLEELRETIGQVFKQYPARFYLAYLDEDGDEITLATNNDLKILTGSGIKSVKIFIKEKSEEFYDETQKIEIVEEELAEEPVEELEKIEEKEEKSIFHADQSEIMSSASEVNLDQSIEEKLKKMLPSIISKIKSEVTEQILNQSKVSQKSKVEEEKKVEQTKVVHRWVNCDGCGKKGIEGIRYKCAVCPDFDFCEKCEAIVDHPHPFLKIKTLKQTPIKIFAMINDETDSMEINGNRVQCPAFNNYVNQGFNMAEQFMRRRTGTCPYKAAQEKKEEPKVETKVETKVEEPVKVEVKPEPKVEVKPQPPVKTPAVTLQKDVKMNTIFQKKPATEEKPIIVSEPPKVEEKPAKSPEEERKAIESRIIENANYLTNILEIDFTKCYKYAAANVQKSKEELLELYFSRGGR